MIYNYVREGEGLFVLKLLEMYVLLSGTMIYSRRREGREDRPGFIIVLITR